MPKKVETPQAKPLLRALQDCADADGEIKRKAYEFLKGPWSFFNSADDFRKAFDGLQCAIQILGPLSPEYRETLKLTRGLLDTFSKTQRLWFENDVRAAWNDALSVIEESLPAEAMARCREYLENVF